MIDGKIGQLALTEILRGADVLGPAPPRLLDLVSERDFEELLTLLSGTDADIMFEAKMKEKSVLPFVKLLKEKADN